MRTKAIWLLLVVAFLAGCGDDDSGGGSSASPGGDPATEADGGRDEAPEASRRDRGTRIVLGDSEFGSMLFDAEDQAIYIFENDSKDESACYGACAEAWPPVYTDGEPRAGEGVDASLLGTIERRDGRRQVTYAGKPLYFYAHEEPGEVRCHNVNLNGGFWWVVGADGKRLP